MVCAKITHHFFVCIDIDKSKNFKEVLQKWCDKSNKTNSYRTLQYGSTIAVFGTARLEDNEIVIVPTKVAKSAQSLLAKKSNIGNNALLIVGGVLIAVGIGFVVYKIWRTRQKPPRYPVIEENGALDEDGDGDDHD